MKTTFAPLRAAALALALIGFQAALTAASLPWTTAGDAALDAYFRAETQRLAGNSLAEIKSFEDWQAKRGEYRQQLFEMLGLSPLPEKTDLQATVTGTVEHELFTVENLHYQSMPGFYVTANLYVPKGLTKPAPAILYVCGHGPVKKDGVSYGNKVTYQHHGAWFARNGYVCLTIDTVQLGELEGIHHGTYREGMWWWNARGYTSAGAEAWNCIRALDYLQSRKEVDGDHLGVTGRSGGGAYSWWISALDDRIKAAVPVAGVTDLHDHVVDGTVEGHCDCMFMVNTFRWDYAHVAALVAPRPLLIANTDKDRIFPLDGVMRVHDQVRRIYELHGAADKLGVLITEGPHKDTQDLQVPAFRWFNRWLKGDDSQVTMTAEKFFEPTQLKVFAELPAAQRTIKIHDTFVPMAQNPVPATTSEWAAMRDGWLTTLKEKSFRGWPAGGGDLKLQQVFAAEREGVRLEAWDFDSQPHVRLRLYVMRGTQATQPEAVVLSAMGDEAWRDAMKNLGGVFGAELGAELKHVDGANPGGFEKAKQLAQGNWVIVGLAPRGVGLTGFVDDARKRVQIKRRFQLLGQTLDGMRVWDIHRAAGAVRALEGTRGLPLWLHGKGDMGVNTLYAGLFVSDVAGLSLEELPASHMTGPDYLNVLRFLDIPQALAMAAERGPVRLRGVDEKDWSYAIQAANRLGWEPPNVNAGSN
jgi:dienelactone hydrolase